MAFTIVRPKRKPHTTAQREIQAKSAGVSSALLATLEQSRPAYSIPQQIFLPILKTSQNTYKSLLSLVVPRSSLARHTHEHGVPSGLFRLPLEIREQIYGLVTGHKTVFKIPENYHQPRPRLGKSNNGPTSLLQTCRQIDAEARMTIYTQNTFHFQNHNDFLAFAHDISPVSLSRITSLIFDLNSLLFVGSDPYYLQCPRFTTHLISGAKQQWEHVWDIIAEMNDLVELKVSLAGFPEWDGMQCLGMDEKEILAPLRRVRRKLQVFEVDVPWVSPERWTSGETNQSTTGGAPFHLIWRGIQPRW